MIALAGGTPGSHVQGRSLVPLLGGRRPDDRRTSFLVEYWSENAMPWLVGTGWTSSTTSRRIPTSSRTSSTIRPARGSARTCGESSPGSWSRRSGSEASQRPPAPAAGPG